LRDFAYVGGKNPSFGMTPKLAVNVRCSLSQC